MKKNILSSALANATREVCEALYNETGVSAVCDYANKIGLRYGPCEPCEAEMPAIETTTSAECACCGSPIQFKGKKDIKRKYKSVTLHLKMLQIAENAIIDAMVTYINKHIEFYDTNAKEIIVHSMVF